MRWYSIAAQLYDLEHELKYPEEEEAKQQLDQQIFHPLYLQELKLSYTLSNIAIKFHLKNHVNLRFQFFESAGSLGMNPLIRMEKIVFNIKQYSDYIYRQYIKGIKKAKQTSNPETPKLICKNDNALQLDNTLKLLKNYLKKQTLNVDFQVKVITEFRSSTVEMNRMNHTDKRLFVISNNLQNVTRLGLCGSGVVNIKAKKAFDTWRRQSSFDNHFERTQN